MISKVVKDTNVEVPVKNVPKGIEITSRKSEENTYVFVQNFNNDAIDIELDVDNGEIILGDYSDGKIQKFGTIVLKK